jgi:hypothetical protein
LHHDTFIAVQTSEAIAVARDLLKERDAARREVYLAHRAIGNNGRMQITCECEICATATAPPSVEDFLSNGGAPITQKDLDELVESGALDKPLRHRQ